MVIEPQEPESDLPTCPGCFRTTGLPGALCPYCGSMYPDPRASEAATVLGVIAAFGIGLALLVQGLSESLAGVLALIGVVALIGALSMGSRARGRIGPAQARQVSCCGCSCAVALLVLPSAGALLWMHGGPVMVAFAFPIWVLVSWVTRGVGVLVCGLSTGKLSFDRPIKSG
jgi:hypothetical protein